MAIGSSLTKGTVRRTGENNKSQLEWSSSDSANINSSPKKGSYQGDSDSDATSFSSSMHGSTSTSSATSSTDRYSRGTEGGTGRKQTLGQLNPKKPTGFGSLRPSRRRLPSRLSQPSTGLPGEDSATVRHPSPVEVSDTSPDNLQKPVQKFNRSGSLRTLRMLRNKNRSSSESKNYSTVEDLPSKRATFSSILKDSKFLVEPQVGVKESEEILPMAKLCPYQHCSLHGHHHHDDPPLKHFVYLKRCSSKGQKSVNPQSRTTLTDKRSGKKREVKVTEKVSNEGGKVGKNENAVGDNKDNVDFSIEFYAKTRSRPIFEANCGHDDADMADILFGVNGLQDDQNEVRNLHLDDQHSSIVTNDKKDENSDGFAHVESKKPALKNGNQIHLHMVSGLVTEPGWELDQQVDKDKRLCIADTNDSSETKGSDSDDAVNQENEIRKAFAIKIVRQAIEKILLPEVQDNQSTTSEKGKPKNWNRVKKVIILRRFITELEKAKKFDPNKSRHIPLVPKLEAEIVSLRRQTNGEKKSSDEWMLDYALQQAVSELASTQRRKVSLLVKAFETVAPTEDEPSKVTSTTPKLHDCPASDADMLIRQSVNKILLPEVEDDASLDLRELVETKEVDAGLQQTWKKWKKLRRSIKALESCRKLKPQQSALLTREQEADLMMGEKKKAEQWMVDYAVQDIVTTLTSARKKRVSMLVEAFEAVIPHPDI